MINGNDCKEIYIQNFNCCSLLYKLKLKTVNFERIKEHHDIRLSYFYLCPPIPYNERKNIRTPKYIVDNIRYPGSIGSSNGNKRTRHGLAKTR